MYSDFQKHLQKELQAIEEAGLYKNERIITSPQQATIKVSTGQEVLNFCANNYLGLSNDKELIKAAKKALDSHGYGMSSVRFICGTEICIKNSKREFPSFSAPKIPYCMLPVSMPMGCIRAITE